MEKVILYYKFVPVLDPETAKLWQKELCERHGLKGRILLNEQGINGTLGGPVEGLKAYVKAMNISLFKGTVFKWSEGSASDFPRLSIKVRPELVAFGAPGTIKVDKKGIVGGGKHLKPHEVHKLVEEKGDDVVFFDGRNAYEAEIGKFKNTVVPNVRYTRDFLKELDDPKYEAIKDKPVVTYCTGGIRCELLSVYMKQKGFKDVYQIDGGIVKYGEAYKDDGLWEGKLYVFDKRMVKGFSESSKDIGKCIRCKDNTSNFENCNNIECNNLILLCKNCANKSITCSEKCLKKVQSKVKI